MIWVLLRQVHSSARVRRDVVPHSPPKRKCIIIVLLLVLNPHPAHLGWFGGWLQIGVGNIGQPWIVDARMESLTIIDPPTYPPNPRLEASVSCLIELRLIRLPCETD